MSWVTVYPCSMSQRGSHLLEELIEPCRAKEEKVPEPFTIDGLVTLDGALRRCWVRVDLYNCKYAVEGIDEAVGELPYQDPAVLRLAEQAGEQLLGLLVDQAREVADNRFHWYCFSIHGWIEA